MGQRVEQLNSLLLREVATIISREIEFPSGTFVTVSKVDVADDAASAKVWISVLPALHQQDVLDSLTSRISDVQSVLNKKLVMKFVPKLTFLIDESGERAAVITKVLDTVAADNGLGLGLDADRVETERLEREAKSGGAGSGYAGKQVSETTPTTPQLP
ncbi:MAG: 30S ribosome-binding factor RbfA [Patescibacteria group bacterium]